MRVGILNWRDIRSPRAGGAEHVTHEIGRRLVERGYEVVWLTARVPGRPDREELDGMTIFRRGTELTTRFHAPRFVRATRPDVVVEEINTLPYFAPVWSPVPAVLYINQLAREVWWYEAPLPLAAVGFASEPLYLRAYRRTPALTISESTRVDLRKLGLRERIDVVPMAVDVPPVERLAAKGLTGELVAVGRLAPSKRYDHAIRALADLRRSHPAATLTIVGSGPEEQELWKLARSLSLEHAVRLPGRITEAEKTALLTRADVLIGTSAREGWGLTVTEAARRGTPSVAYDIPGFRDSISDGRTGVLTRPDPGALATSLRGLLSDRDRYEALRTRALQESLTLSWERSADVFEAALLERLGAPAAQPEIGG